MASALVSQLSNNPHEITAVIHSFIHSFFAPCSSSAGVNPIFTGNISCTHTHSAAHWTKTKQYFWKPLVCLIGGCGNFAGNCGIGQKFLVSQQRVNIDAFLFEPCSKSAGVNPIFTDNISCTHTHSAAHWSKIKQNFWKPLVCLIWGAGTFAY